MKVLTNTAKRRLGIPGRPALILNANQSQQVTEAQLDDIKQNRTVARWIESGVLTVTEDGEAVPVPKVEPVKPRKPTGLKDLEDKREEQELPEGVEGEGVEMHHVGGGWWEVYVNGFKVTDANVRKDEAVSIAEEYE